MSRSFPIFWRTKVLALVASIFFVIGSGIALSQTPAKTRSPELESGIKLVTQNKNAEAVEILKQATTKSKEDAEAWYYLGFAYIKTGDMKNAVSNLEKATLLQPRYATAHTALAYALMRRGKLSQAKSEAEKSITIDPTNADAHYTLGVIDFRIGLRAEALTNAEQAIQYRADFAEAYLLQSQALVGLMSAVVVDGNEEPLASRLARYRKAALALEKYLELAPNSLQKDFWHEQLESLRFYSEPEKYDVYTGRQVTTKVRLLHRPVPDYTGEAQRDHIQGTVVLRAVFAEDGRVKHILVLQAVPGGLTEVAVKAARGIKFIPATKDGKPVSMWMQLEYNFS